MPGGVGHSRSKANGVDTGPRTGGATNGPGGTGDKSRGQVPRTREAPLPVASAIPFAAPRRGAGGSRCGGEQSPAPATHPSGCRAVGMG